VDLEVTHLHNGNWLSFEIEDHWSLLRRFLAEWFQEFKFLAQWQITI
jgi:hypothetical protein